MIIPFFLCCLMCNYTLEIFLNAIKRQSLILCCCKSWIKLLLSFTLLYIQHNYFFRFPTRYSNLIPLYSNFVAMLSIFADDSAQVIWQTEWTNRWIGTIQLKRFLQYDNKFWFNLKCITLFKWIHSNKSS